jgi:NAD(P)-dependent dehydrogenase (short-subunit alcohol dehydrogenase family)
VTDPFDLSGRTALITGATGRLGRAFSHALSTAGSRMILTGQCAERLDALSEDLGPSAIATVAADLSTGEGVDAVFEAVERLGIGLDVLVNNAGIASSAKFGSLAAKDFGGVYAVNVIAAALCSQRAAMMMRERGGGKIVNIGSIYGSVAPDPAVYAGADEMVQASSPYVASKAALLALTRDLAVRLAPWNIQVNMLSPGGVQAGQPEAFRHNYERRTPAGRMGRPEDVGGALIFLAAPASDYVTGQNILVDGGFTVW